MKRLAILPASLALCLFAVPARADDAPHFAGPTARGFLLPNGWTISPAGEQVALTDLPLNIVPLNDGRHVLVASNGYNKHELVLVDLHAKKVVSRGAAPESWFGLAVSAAGDSVWWSGGGSGLLHTFALKDGRL